MHFVLWPVSVAWAPHWELIVDCRKIALLALLIVETPALAVDPGAPSVTPPAALVLDQVPAVPQALADATRPYLEARSAVFRGWAPASKGALITTRFGNTSQVHEVAAPMGDRRQRSFESDTIAAASYARRKGDVLVVQKDVGGSEFWQLYTLKDGRLTLLTDGKSRNEINAWSHDGRWLAYTSTRRTGSDSDIYIVDPRDPKSDRLVAQVSGGGWSLLDFTADGTSAVVANQISVNKSDLFFMDVASGTMRPIGDHSKAIAYGDAKFSYDGILWVTSDEGSDFLRLGRINVTSGRFIPVGNEPRWDVADFDVSADGKQIAYVLNEEGVDRLKLLDTTSGAVRAVTALPAGTIGTLQFAPWGALGFTLSSAKSPADTYALDPATLAVTRWTMSETGGLDASRNVEPELIKAKSFDGLEVSGFLYRPDAAKFPGKRPLVVSIHGGPEGEATPGFLGRSNYLVNELGIALFLPNVRGSTGFGKRFVALDNGPFKREDSVRDIGAFLDRLAADPAIDAARIAETGGSYGGYMCYAAAIRYGARLKAASCIVAISNFVTFLQNTQGYRRDLRRVEYGDERDPKQGAKLIAISPLTHAADLKIPLMVTTGGNDPRVPPSEADQMVKAVRANNVPAWAMLAKDEGHGYSKKDNVDYQFWATILFWQRNLIGAEAR
ncbi:S9 family peptidase [Sphingomonas bacterium]|uniref:S9 family peptidase n=1 Tax=Sphingomonas bacterium TaxID=1895847 RepID=UPI0020C70DA2|nr:prolyl oligopeptidase family serine peptidase [Sphingomonas bacterium]